MSYMCLQCTNEFNRYWQQQLEHVPQDIPRAEQITLIQKLYDESERHMWNWMSERGKR